MLEHPSGLQCCLGQYLSQCGVTKAEMLHMGMPSGLLEVPQEAAWLITTNKHNTPLAADLQRINDDEQLTVRKRERLIANLFAKAGITVEFTGEYSLATSTAVTYSSVTR